MRGCATADVQEVSGVAAVQLDDVHGGHGQTRTVYHAPDVSCNVLLYEICAQSAVVIGFYTSIYRWEKVYFAQVKTFSFWLYCLQK